jgi:hypothetical protein
MQQPIPNNDQNRDWKIRLEDETAFAGEAFINSNAAWDTLYSRLHKPQRKKRAGYWMAAASFVAIITGVFLLQDAKQQQEIITIKNSTEQKPIAAGIKPVQQNENVATLPGKDMVTTVSATKRQVKLKVVEQQYKEINVTAIDTVKELAEVVSPVLVQAAEKEQTNHPVTTVQVKPTLKVVHVNELGVNPQNSINKPGSDYSVLRIGTNNKATQSAGKIGIQISTAKTSPVN